MQTWQESTPALQLRDRLWMLLKLNVMCEQQWIQFELQNSPSIVLHLMAKYTLPFNKPVKSDHS